MLLPCPCVGTGCGRWTQPWAGTGTRTELQDGGATLGVPPPAPCPGAAAGLCGKSGLWQRCFEQDTSSDNSKCPCAWEEEPSTSVPNPGIRVTSEASDGQSAMEMVILYCVSLGGRGRALEWRFPLPRSLWNFSSHTANQPCWVCCPFRKVRTDGSQNAGSLCLHSNQIRLRYSLACFFTGVNADLSVFYAGSQ